MQEQIAKMIQSTMGELEWDELTPEWQQLLLKTATQTIAIFNQWLEEQGAVYMGQGGGYVCYVPLRLEVK